MGGTNVFVKKVLQKKHSRTRDVRLVAAPLHSFLGSSILILTSFVFVLVPRPRVLAQIAGLLAQHL